MRIFADEEVNSIISCISETREMMFMQIASTSKKKVAKESWAIVDESLVDRLQFASKNGRNAFRFAS